MDELAPLTFTVDSRVSISKKVADYLGPDKVKGMAELCTFKNPAFLTWLKYKRGRRPAEFLNSSLLNADGSWSYPRGRFAQIDTFLGEDYSIIDKRVKVEAPKVEWKGHTPYPYQTRLINGGLEKLELDELSAGVWRAPPASGKTSTALILCSKLGLNTLVVVPNNSVFTQWIERAREYLGVEVGVIGAGKWEIGKLITVGSHNTIWRHCDKVAPLFGAVIVDEAQVVGSATYQKFMNESPALFRLAVSGDEKRADGKHVLIYDQFGEVSEEVSHEEAKSSGGLVDVDVVIVPTQFKADWYTKLTPQRKFLKRKDLIEEITKDEIRNDSILRITAGINREGEQAVVLSSRREHCIKLNSELQQYGKSVLLIGGESDFEFNRRLLASREASFGVGTYQAIGVGFESHRELSRGIFATPVVTKIENRMQFCQYLGRFGRSAAGKCRGKIYYLLDIEVFGKRPAKLIASWLGEDKVYLLHNGKEVPIKDWLKKKGNEYVETENAETGDTGAFAWY